MPAVRHPALGIHPLDGDIDGHLPMAGQRDLAVDTPAWREGTFELHAKPGAELRGVGKRTPDTRLGCAQNDLFLDAVGRVMQLHGCILLQQPWKRNRLIAYMDREAPGSNRGPPTNFWSGLSPQLTAFFTSAPILASTSAVNSVKAKAVGHMAPSSRFASSLKPNVAYLVLNFCALWKKQTTLPSLVYAGIPYQSFGERDGALALMTACSRLPMARSGSGISAIFASTALSPSALSAREPRRAAAFSSWARSFIAARSSSVNPLNVLPIAVVLLADGLRLLMVFSFL